MQPDDLDVRFENGELTLHGKVAPRNHAGHARRMEYGIGDFYRSFEVAIDVEADRIDADYKLGVLTIRLPKKEAIKPKKIAIKANKGSRPI